VRCIVTATVMREPAVAAGLARTVLGAGAGPGLDAIRVAGVFPAAE
jgi:hypothetical protein